jgi:hypothetical protein
MSSKNIKNDGHSEWGQFGSLITKEQYSNINKLYTGLNKDNEFEIMFYNYGNTVMNYDKYKTVLSFLTQRSKAQKMSIKTYNILDIIYTVDNGENNYRISIEGIENINKYMKMLHQKKNHVIFRVLTSMMLDGNKDIKIIKKIKEKENISDIEQFEIRFRKSDEIGIDKKEFKLLTELSETERDQIIFRFKERVSLFIKEDTDHVLRIDLTKVKTTKNINKTENSNPRYELELDLNVKKSSDTFLNELVKELNILLKILQQSNFIISNT